MGHHGPALREAGHRPLALTLPGVGQASAATSDIGIDDWVAAVVAQIDRADAPVVLVGQSGGGNVAWGAAAAHADRVARVVFVDTLPPPPGSEISKLPVFDGVVPFPGWGGLSTSPTSPISTTNRRPSAPPSSPRRAEPRKEGCGRVRPGQEAPAGSGRVRPGVAERCLERQ